MTKRRHGKHASGFLESGEGRRVLKTLEALPGVKRVVVGKRFNGRMPAGLTVAFVGDSEVTVKVRVSTGTYMLHVNCAAPNAVAHMITAARVC